MGRLEPVLYFFLNIAFKFKLRNKIIYQLTVDTRCITKKEEAFVLHTRNKWSRVRRNYGDWNLKALFFFPKNIGAFISHFFFCLLFSPFFSLVCPDTQCLLQNNTGVSLSHEYFFQKCEYIIYDFPKLNIFRKSKMAPPSHSRMRVQQRFSSTTPILSPIVFMIWALMMFSESSMFHYPDSRIVSVSARMALKCDKWFRKLCGVPSDVSIRRDCEAIVGSPSCDRASTVMEAATTPCDGGGAGAIQSTTSMDILNGAIIVTVYNLAKMSKK